MKTDRELLELAAMADGHRVICEACQIVAGATGVMLEGVQKQWSPLNDIGEAASLAIRLRISISFEKQHDSHPWSVWAEDKEELDECQSLEAATCRAIVRCAAQLALDEMTGGDC